MLEQENWSWKNNQIRRNLGFECFFWFIFIIAAWIYLYIWITCTTWKIPKWIGIFMKSCFNYILVWSKYINNSTGAQTGLVCCEERKQSFFCSSSVFFKRTSHWNVLKDPRQGYLNKVFPALFYHFFSTGCIFKCFLYQRFFFFFYKLT